LPVEEPEEQFPVEKRRVNGRRGRPRKFSSPSHLVALTLPDEVVTGLRRIHPDLAWAIVSLFRDRATGPDPGPPADFELLRIAERRSLIVVNRTRVTHLPGVDMVPLSADYAFLAVATDRGLSDLELAVVDRLEEPTLPGAERVVLHAFRTQLRQWRRNRSLTFRTRAILVVEGHETVPAISQPRRRPKKPS
jgi:hypothetical protein